MLSMGPSRLAAGALLLCALGIALAMLARGYDYQAAQREYTGYQAAPEETSLPRPAPTPPEIRVWGAAQGGPGREEALATQAPAPSSRPEPEGSKLIRRYRKQNQDTVAYLDVLNTRIQYPVVQGSDNEYYRTHTFGKKRRAAGAIFLDAWNVPGFSDFNTVVYGHNMKDGSMFHGLREYRHPAFLREHKYIEVALADRTLLYKVFAAYTATEDMDFRGFACDSSAKRASFMREIQRRSEIRTNATATSQDTLLTLVTCTGTQREPFWIVHGVLQQTIGEAP